MTDPSQQPTSQPPDPWRGQSGDPGSPSWSGPWSSPSSPPPRDGGDSWQRDGGDPWRAPPRPARTRTLERGPLAAPPTAPHILWLELGLVLLLAFAPGILSLLIQAIDTSADSGPADQLVPAIVGGLFTLFLSWSPVLLVGYLLVRSGEGRRGIGLGRFEGRADGLVGLGMWLASFVLVLLLARLLQPLGEEEVDFLPQALPLWFRVVDAFVIAITAGVTEEVMVRGYAQTRLEQLKMPTAVILLLPTGLWGLLHLYQGLGAALTIFCLGLLYAWYYQRTRRLWPIIIAHTLFDLTQLALILTDPR